MRAIRPHRTGSLVGQDVAEGRPRKRSRIRGYPALLLGTLLAGLLLAVLRIDIVRLGYALLHPLVDPAKLRPRQRHHLARAHRLSAAATTPATTGLPSQWPGEQRIKKAPAALEIFIHGAPILAI